MQGQGQLSARQMCVVFLLGLVLMLADCGGMGAPATVVYTNGASTTRPSQYGLVAFRVPLDQATAILANLDVFPYSTCTGWGAGAGIPWTSPAEAYGANGYSASDIHTNSLWVYAPAANAGFGPASPPDWATRLAANPAVDFIETGDVHFSCPFVPLDAHPLSDRPYFLASAPSQPPSYLRVVFSSETTYDDAVSAMIDQGLRLANPCAERANAPWAPLSQEAPYSDSHTLTLALTIASSTLWIQQLKALPNVMAVHAPYSPAC